MYLTIMTLVWWSWAGDNWSKQGGCDTCIVIVWQNLQILWWFFLSGFCGWTVCSGWRSWPVRLYTRWCYRRSKLTSWSCWVGSDSKTTKIVHVAYLGTGIHIGYWQNMYCIQWQMYFWWDLIGVKVTKELLHHGFPSPKSIGFFLALLEPLRNDADFLFSSKKDYHVKSMTQ